MDADTKTQSDRLRARIEAFSRREEKPQKPSTRVITVRLDAETHELLIAQAHRSRISLNRLAIAALETALDELAEPSPNSSKAPEGADA